MQLRLGELCTLQSMGTAIVSEYKSGNRGRKGTYYMLRYMDQAGDSLLENTGRQQGYSPLNTERSCRNWRDLNPITQFHLYLHRVELGGLGTKIVSLFNASASSGASPGAYSKRSLIQTMDWYLQGESKTVRQVSYSVGVKETSRAPSNRHQITTSGARSFSQKEDCYLRTLVREPSFGHGQDPTSCFLAFLA